MRIKKDHSHLVCIWVVETISCCKLHYTNKCYIHLLNLGTSCSPCVGFVKSSKLIIYNDISSTSERIGAMTSEQRNFCPAIKPIRKWNKVLTIFNFNYIFSIY